MLKWSRNSVTTSSASPARSRPLSTKMQVSWSPIASCSSAADDRGIDAAREAADHPALADLRADPLDRLVAERGHRPVAAAAARRDGRSSGAAPRRAACARPRDGTARRRSAACRRRWRRRARPRSTPTTRKPGGSASTRSPWLIHTCSRSPFGQTPVEERAVVGDVDDGAAELAVVGRPRRGRPAARTSSARRSRCRAPARPARTRSSGARGAAVLVHRGRAAREDDRLRARRRRSARRRC